jgi:hypothetical protein
MKHFLVTVMLFCGAESAQATVVSNVHNAPGWLPNHAYTAGQRVNSGPGWDSTKFIPYQPLAAYQAAANCTSGTTKPTGTGTAIADGSCSWKYLSPTDYVTLTGWANDGVPWAAGSYAGNAVALAGVPLTAYRQTNTAGCTSTTAPPTAPADGCTWVALAPVTYTSGRSFIPWMAYDFSTPDLHLSRVLINQIYQANLWNDREYTIGQNGEVGRMFQQHNDVISTPIGGENLIWPAACNFPNASFNMLCPMTITAAPGESFADTLAANPSLPLTGPDQANGVLITGQVTMTDNSIVWRRVQLKNSSGSVLAQPGHSCNPCSVENSIIEAAGDTATFGGMSMFLNDLIIVHGANTVGVKHDYPGILAHSTVVNPEGNGGICVETNWDWVWPGSYVIDTACFGFAHAAAGIKNFCTDELSCAVFIGTKIMTSSPSEPDYTQTIGTTWDGINGMFTRTIPDTIYGINPSDVFVTWPGDYRLKATSPLRGSDVAFGVVPNRCAPRDFQTNQPETCPQPVGDTPDIIGTPRPSTGQDIGAWQTKSAPRRSSSSNQ